MGETTAIDPALHRRLAGETFNGVWALLDRVERAPEEDEEMVHMAHASRWHWGRVGTALEWARGEWQLARVYAVVGRAEPALHHAERCLALCVAHGLGDFDRAYAHEALARAFLVAGQPAEAAKQRAEAEAIAARVTDEAERALLSDDLATLAAG